MYVWKKEVTRTSTSFTEHIAVFIRALSGSNTEKKVNLEQMVVAAHGFFFFFPVFLYFFDIFLHFFCVRVLRLLLFCGMDNINKRDSRERKKKYTTYITLCYEQNINL